MIPAIRKIYNEAFTEDKYQAFLEKLNSRHPGAIDFRLAETPVFLPANFVEEMLETCEAIIDIIKDPSFKEKTDRSIPESDRVPNDEGTCNMIAFDFGICSNTYGDIEPRLIEMQGFPTLFGFQTFYPEILKEFFPVPENFSQYLGKHNRDSFIELFSSIVLGNHSAENVILLEIKPHTQKTRIDFYFTRDLIGIQPVCITELIQEGQQLFYMNEGIKTRVNRIYNRVIFDELHAREKELGKFVDIRQDLDVEWVPHPSWFYRISKFTLPFIRHPFVPKTYFLNEIKEIPADLENYVLKPLFSFAGQGVIVDLALQDIENIADPENWILQQKVQYAPVIETPDEPAKAEIRIMYLWKNGEDRPEPVLNLARLSKGKMIGVNFNKDKKWIGGSVALVKTP